MNTALISKKQLAAQAGVSPRTLRRYILRLKMDNEITSNMRLVPAKIAAKLLEQLGGTSGLPSLG